MENRDKARKGLNRREFIVRSAAATLAASIAPGALLAGESKFHPVPSSPLPGRAFGSTGARIPILTFGCGSRWMMYEDDEAVEVINQAIDSGIIYLDSEPYGGGT